MINITALKRITDHNGDFPAYIATFDNGKRFYGQFVVQLIDNEIEIKSKYYSDTETINVPFWVNGVEDIEICLYFNADTKERRFQNYPEKFARPKPWVEGRGFLDNPVPQGARSILNKNFLEEDLPGQLIDMLGPTVMAEMKVVDADRDVQRALSDFADKEKEFKEVKAVLAEKRRELRKAKTKLSKFYKKEESLADQLKLTKVGKNLAKTIYNRF